MIKFYTKEIAPLKFHKLYHLVVTPLNIVLAIYALYSLVTGSGAAGGATIAYAYEGLLILSCVLTFIGCFHFKKYAWWAIMLGFVLELFYDIYYLIATTVINPAFFVDALSQVLWRMVAVVFMFIYYLKRRPLFFDPISYEEFLDATGQKDTRKKKAVRK